MGFLPQACGRILSASLLGLILFPLFPWSCERSRPVPPAPTPPPRPDYYEQAETYFETGDYARAAQAYESYLNDNPSAANLDKALFRLALVHVLPESPVHNPPRAQTFLQELIVLYPESPYRSEAEFLMGLQKEVDRLRSAVQARQADIQQLNQELEQMEQLRNEVEQLRSDINKREARIRQLSQELEQLKQIDMERRPSRPPP